MTSHTGLIWPLLIALTAGACARQQPAYYALDSATGQPVAQPPAPRQAGERGLFNNLASRPTAPSYAPQAYAQQQHPQPQYAQQPPAPQGYAQPYGQPAPQHYQPQPGVGGPYAAAPQSNPYAQARWY